MTTVLVVEDDADHLKAVALILRLAGCDVRTATTGEAALDALEALLPDVVVLDVRLPGIDGLEVLRCMRAGHELTTLPVILCSAHADTGAWGFAAPDAHARFLAKPYHPDELIALIRSARNNHEPRGAVI